MILTKDFQQIEKLLYQKCNFEYTTPTSEEEGSEYGAGDFKLNGLSIKLRSSKITPKKVGQFVTLWKRNSEGETKPYDISDGIDLVVINARKDDRFGQFVFPQIVLEKQGILSSTKSKGKRGFRIYPPWDQAQNKQAIKTQKWQLNYFIEVDEDIDLEKIKDLYLKN